MAIHPLARFPRSAQGSHPHGVRGDLRLPRRCIPWSGLGPRDEEKADYYRWFSTPPDRWKRQSRTRRWGSRCRRSASGCSAMAISSAPLPRSTSFSHCAIMSAASASRRPMSMSARKSCSQCSSECCRSATASSAIATACRPAPPTSGQPRLTKSSSLRWICDRQPQPQPA